MSDNSNPPSGDLEKRLAEILETMVEDGTFYGEIGPEIEGATEQAITSILTAIKDAGYTNKRNYYTKVGNTAYISNGVDQVRIVDATDKELMTGAEWYERFEKEAPMSTEPHVFEAAKRAAGIDER